MAPFPLATLCILFLLPLRLNASPQSHSSVTSLLFNPSTQILWIDYASSAADSFAATTVLVAENGSPRPSPTAVPLLQFRRQLSSTPSNSCEDWSMWQKVGLLAVVCLIILPVVGLAIYTQQRKVPDDRVLGEALRSLPGMPREFRYAELSRVTGEFSETNVLGRGGFGVVYRGKLVNDWESGDKESLEVAIKTFSRETSRGDFLAELTIINCLRHRNLVTLLGWCYKNKKLLLVYEYMANGSLDKHLFNQPWEKPLSWDRRYNVVLGVASALHYLHNDYHQKVIHRDLKASNIMLDSSFNACLGDFGLARAVDSGDNAGYEELEGIPGTWGYIAPELFHTGKATGKSDIFAFGAVVLEVVCGRRPGVSVAGYRMLLDWVWAKYEEGELLAVVDCRLESDYYPKEEAARLLLLGLACSHPIASERPKTQTILQVLSKSISPPDVDKKRPSFALPALREKGSARWRSTAMMPIDGVTTGFTEFYSSQGTFWMDKDRSSTTDDYNSLTIGTSNKLSDSASMLH